MSTIPEGPLPSVQNELELVPNKNYTQILMTMFPFNNESVLLVITE
jgi:hypothetical protein